MSRVLVCGLGLAAVVLLPLAARAAEATRAIEVRLDATEAPRKLLHAQLVIPAAPGPLTLYYPKWIPGEHSPSGPINDLSGLKLRAGGKALDWRRDDVDLYAFHCTVPDGADAVEVTLDYLAPSSKEGFTSGASITEKLAILNWNQVILYPKDRSPHDITVNARLTLPRGWKQGSALPVEADKGDTIQYKTVTLETLVDSPVLCGAHFKEISLDAGTDVGPRHFLTLACDSAAGLDISPELKAHFERLVAEAGALYGARHYRSYHFLVALTDHFRPDGIEHHECSDNRLPERFLVDETYRKHWGCWLLPHEYTHSWNGKYRRPDGLATPDYQQPMKTKLLWVYEGLTQYLGLVLAARSGLFTPELSHENLARIADWARSQKGRTWRPLEDTTVSAPYLYYAHDEWSSRRRGVDFYDEGVLLWLEVDTLIREKSGGKKSLDDFCRAFYGGKDGAPEVKTYKFEDVVKALNDVVAHDWKGLLEKRLNSTSAEPPLDGLARGGWEVVYRDKMGDLLKERDDDEKTITLSSSVGLLLKDDGQVVDVIPGTAADKAGVGPGMKVVGVNDRKFTAERVRQGVAATHGGHEKLVLLLENNEYFKTVTLDYTNGERYPHLERVKEKPDVLADIFRGRAAKKTD
jgi:predicted metalloprotease with PDZ domain